MNTYSTVGFQKPEQHWPIECEKKNKYYNHLLYLQLYGLYYDEINAL